MFPAAAGRDPVATLLAFTDEPVRLCPPGPHPAVPLLLEHRRRITAYDHRMSGSPDLVDAGRALSPSLC